MAASEEWRPSILDRLAEPGLEPVGWDPLRDRTAIVEHLNASIRRNLEWVLGSQRPSPAIGREHQALVATIQNYGMTDPFSRSRDGEDFRSELAVEIRQAIERFEPRLTKVEVHALPASELSRSIAFSVKALIRVSGVEEPIAFTPRFNMGDGGFAIEEARP